LCHGLAGIDDTAGKFDFVTISQRNFHFVAWMMAFDCGHKTEHQRLVDFDGQGFSRNRAALDNVRGQSPATLCTIIGAGQGQFRFEPVNPHQPEAAGERCAFCRSCDKLHVLAFDLPDIDFTREFGP
jgi:hypothetical protein